MTTRLRGLAEKGENLYLITDDLIIEIENPEKGILRIGSRERIVSPPAALYPFVGRPASLVLGDEEVSVRKAGAEASVLAERVVWGRARIALSRSLGIAGLIADSMLPGVAYFDAVARAPGLAVPEWAGRELARACSSIPVLDC